MRSVKRKVADALGQALGAHIVPRHGVGSLYEQECIRRVLDTFEVDCVFDVGANSGQYASMLRDRVRYNGPIISFEPVPHLATEIEHAAIEDPDWHVRCVALDSEIRDTVFRITADTQFSSLRQPNGLSQAIFGGQVRVANELSLTTSTLAVEMAHWQKRLGFKRPYLKMDTQGNDIAVAEGAGVMLTAFVAIQTETAIAKLYDNIPDLTQTLSFFRDRGFELSAFVPNNEGVFPRLIETDCIFVNRALMDQATGASTQIGT